ncbi:MAG: hypothetical protein JWQ87_4825 [Candidatus Sulfotelmatobacter sp.]|nr:hypothetical protein [Candidatus Sulfotelmatobacter sp.]
MSKALEALRKAKQLPPQTPVEIQRGYTTRRTQGGIPVHRLHYSAHPERDPETHPEWKAVERKLYTSQASWDREQEIVDEAGGGELVFADTLLTYWNKIVITDPKWRPEKDWRQEGGFDHGKTNPTALERIYIDYAGTIYFCGEYYQPGKEIWQHAPVIYGMADIRKMAACYADPTIFDMTLQQSQQAGKPAERAKSVNELYVEQSIGLFSPFVMDRSDVSFAARLMAHWANLDEREPTVKIVCRNYSEKPQFGLHNWDCPNLLWELMRTRRVRLSSQQLLSRNAAEAIMDKDNHARDAMKYVLMSHPQAAEKTLEQRAAEAVKPLAEIGDLTSALIRHQQIMEEGEATYRARLGRQRWR